MFSIASVVATLEVEFDEKFIGACGLWLVGGL